MAEPSPAISLPWMSKLPPVDGLKPSWEAEQEDGSWKHETATLQRGESHPLLELCRKSVADFDRRTRGNATSLRVFPPKSGLIYAMKTSVTITARVSESTGTLRTTVTGTLRYADFLSERVRRIHQL
jgi:hypothetical protein